MNPNIKAILISMIVFYIVFIVIFLILDNFTDNQGLGVLTAISAVIAFLLSPRRQIVVTQSGKNIYLKWIFSQKVYRIN